MAKYRKKIEIIEASQWNPKNREGWPGIGEPDRFGVVWEFDTNGKVCQGDIEDTLDGLGCIVSIGDWIITYENGEKDVVALVAFERDYEKVEEQ